MNVFFVTLPRPEVELRSRRAKRLARRRRQRRRERQLLAALLVLGIMSVVCGGVLGFRPAPEASVAGAEAAPPSATLVDVAGVMLARGDGDQPGWTHVDTTSGGVTASTADQETAVSCGVIQSADKLAGYARVAGAGWPGLRLRTGPGITFPTQVVVIEGATVALFGPVCMGSDGGRWRGIGVEGGLHGWSAAEYLTEIDAGAFVTSRLTPPPGPQTRPVVQVKVTAYTYQEPIGGAHGWITRSGVPVRPGMVAVDPSVIPLGSSLLIDGYDTVFLATDTGHGVRGAHVDVFYPDHARAVDFGVQYREVTILD